MSDLAQMLGVGAAAPAEVPLRVRPPIHGDYRNSGNFHPEPIKINETHPRGHLGIDVRAPGGTPIYPILPGVVTSVSTNKAGGQTVNIEHAGGVRSYYAHCGTILVWKGDRVTTDTPIATVGDTTGEQGTEHGAGSCHLHLQVWQGDKLLNPATLFDFPPYSDFYPGELFWLSPEHKARAYAFRVAEHNRIGRKVPLPGMVSKTKKSPARTLFWVTLFAAAGVGSGLWYLQNSAKTGAKANKAS